MFFQEVLRIFEQLCRIQGILKNGGNICRAKSTSKLSLELPTNLTNFFPSQGTGCLIISVECLFYEARKVFFVPWVVDQ